ncbi:DUF58 domain-containing protein [bacterium]|nr:DUF58 domain-containing protein [bacterium]
MKRVTLTARVILLILMGALPLMTVGSHLAGLMIFLVFNLAVVSLIMLDYKMTPQKQDIEVERICPGKLSIGEKNKITIKILNRSRRDISIRVHDEYPVEFEKENPDKRIDIQIKKRSMVEISYFVTPLNRGAFEFRNIVMSYRGILELIDIHVSFQKDTCVRVYPNIKSISKFELMVRRSHLMETGITTERRRGTGTEFESLKEFTRDDEYRKIDWKASARRNKLICRQYQAEINQSIIVAIDCSRPMGAMVDKFNLLDYAVNATLLLGHLVTKKEDKIGLLVFSDKVHQFIPPSRGKKQYHYFLEQLYNLHPRRVEPEYEPAFKFLMNTRCKRSLFIILTDLASGVAHEKLRESISLVSSKHLVVVLSVTNPDFKDSARKIPDTVEEVYRKVVAQETIEKMRLAGKSVEKIGVKTHFLGPEELTTSLLGSYLTQKSRSHL